MRLTKVSSAESPRSCAHSIEAVEDAAESRTADIDIQDITRIQVEITSDFRSETG